jgi:ferredoxin--NADP+ reductase
MVRSGINEQKTLVQGSRTPEGFYFFDEFEKALGKNYIKCCSGEKLPDYYPGRVSDFLAAENNLPSDNMYYLCGSAEMVVSVRDLLISRNIPFSNIVSEIYF